MLPLSVSCLKKAKQLPQSGAVSADADSATEDDPQAALHEGRTECAVCHEAVRPEDESHPAEGDCVSCHSYPTWAISEEEEEGATTFNHDPLPDSCVSCHEGDRPQPEHNGTTDCALCHTFPNWDDI